MSGNKQGGLTTHVLDTMHGTPAEGMEIHFYEIDNGERLPIKIVKTNADGRVDAPLMQGDEFRFGTFELEFHVGDYYRAKGIELPKPAFIDVVPLRFGTYDHSHYHVPLLVSPYSYSTYRGS